ncbi:MAG: YlmC/YmxH family sporulation protein [Lachnospirales bacterium]
MEVIFIISFSELREKEVINIRDGSRYGCVVDIIFNIETGNIAYLVIPMGTKFFGLMSGGQELRISYCDIEQIGDDLIIVNIDTSKCIHNY